MNSQLSPDKIGGAGRRSAFPFHAGRSSRAFLALHGSCRRRSLYRSLVHRSSMHAHRLVVAVVGMAAITCCVQAQAAFTPETTNSEYSVVVHYGKDITVPQAIAPKLQSDVLEMMKTANYNSRMPHRGVWQHAESISEITRRYRDVVANGKYVLIVWGHPQKVQSVIGEVTAVEAIVELEKPGVWMCVVDDEGRLAHLGKFRGDILTKMEKLIRELVK